MEKTFFLALAFSQQMRLITCIVVKALSIGTLIGRGQWARVAEVDRKRAVAHALTRMIDLAFVTGAVDHIGSVVDALATDTTGTIGTLGNVAFFTDQIATFILDIAPGRVLAFHGPTVIVLAEAVRVCSCREVGTIPVLALSVTLCPVAGAGVLAAVVTNLFAVCLIFQRFRVCQNQSQLKSGFSKQFENFKLTRVA